MLSRTIHSPTKAATAAVTLFILIVFATLRVTGQTVHLHVPYLKVEKNQDAILTSIYNAPLKTGAIYFEWKKNAPWTTDIFRFFISSQTPVTARTTYTRASYVDPRVRMQLSLTGGKNSLFDPLLPNPSPDHTNIEVTFGTGVWHRVLYVWAERDGIVYLGCFVNGRQVAFRRIPGSFIGQWVRHPIFIGARDLAPVEPSFPARHHVDGELRNLWMVGWK